MRILFLTTAHNSLSQRAAVELTARGHEVSIELALSNELMIEATEHFRPGLIVAPFLKKAIPEDVWQNYKCFIVHPGIKGDRGPSSLDWAIHHDEEIWGVTVLEAAAEMDAGDIWATRTFPTSSRPISKSSLYRGDVAEAAISALLEAVEKFASGSHGPEPLDYSKADVRGRLRQAMKQEDRQANWAVDTSATIVRKIRAADSNPGLLDRLFDKEYFVFGAHEEDQLKGPPGAIIAQRDGAICRGTADGAVWITHLKARTPGQPTFKLPATMALGEHAASIPFSDGAEVVGRTFREIRYREQNGVGYLSFDFYNGAMSTEQCLRLRDAYVVARSRPTKVIALLGGRDFWSNGIHLNTIEAARDPAHESWLNINAIDDLILEILNTESHLVVAGVRANAGAGGAMLALAADRVYARRNVVFNPHYKAMGLFGSEYWTYTLPRRVGAKRAIELTEACLPLGARDAREIGFIDDTIDGDLRAFDRSLTAIAEGLASASNWDEMVREKRERRAAEFAIKPLAQYREEELTRMSENFYGPASTYHDARRRFVYKTPPTQTCARITPHRARHKHRGVVFDARFGFDPSSQE